jgi:hypothetical protein
MVMNLPDAAAEFARQVVIALVGDAGRAEQADTECDFERDQLQRAIEKLAKARRQRDELMRAAQAVVEAPIAAPELTALAKVIECIEKEIAGS